MFGIKAVLFISLVINVLVNGYQGDEHLDGELEVLLKRLQERLEDEERGYELDDLFERGFGGMFLSGYGVDPDAIEKYNELKKSEGVYKWMTLKLDETRLQVVVDKTGAPRGSDEDEAQFNEMKDELTSEPRYIVFHFNFMSKKGFSKSYIVFIVWVDDDTPSKDKLEYSTTIPVVTQKFSGINVVIEVNEKRDFDYETIVAKADKNTPIH